jgi:hypothetical protein
MRNVPDIRDIYQGAHSQLPDRRDAGAGAWALNRAQQPVKHDSAIIVKVEFPRQSAGHFLIDNPSGAGYIATERFSDKEMLWAADSRRTES